MEICDQSFILDEWLIMEDPLGDNLTEGAYFNKLLSLPGIAAAKIGIASTAGRVCPSAAPGEDWATRPSAGTVLGDYLRKFDEKFGFGRQTVIGSDGVWRWRTRLTSLFSIGGHAAHFSSDPLDTNSQTYPGRFAVLAPLESIRDLDRYFNRIRVEGADDPDTGAPIVATWELTRGFSMIGGGPPSKIYIGRTRDYVCTDSGLRTRSDVLYVRRSLLAAFGQPPIFAAFTTYFHRGLKPGDLITVDGTLCRIVSISGASIRDDRMNIIARECEGVTLS